MLNKNMSDNGCMNCNRAKAEIQCSDCPNIICKKCAQDCVGGPEKICVDCWKLVHKTKHPRCRQHLNIHFD